MDIVVAEDHPVSAKLLEKILARAGHAVHLAADGEEAWELLLRHRARMLLTDWMMPRLDGLSLCRRVRDKRPAPYVYLILLTARDAASDMLSGFDAGADDYIAKPVNPDELMARIRVGLRHLSLEDRNEKTLRQLMRTEKLASLGQLAAGMAHEINNPLSFLSSNLKTLGRYTQAIQTFIRSHQSLVSQLATPGIRPEPLLEKIKTLEKQTDMAYILEDIETLVTESKTGIERIRKLVEDMRIFTDPGAMRLERHDIRQCIHISLSMLGQHLGDGITVVKSLEEVPLVLCFPQQLEQVFHNVFLNAIQAMENRGSLSIETRTEDGHVRIRVQDTGTGMAPEILPRIFDPFFTTRPVGQGTGLGLHVAHTLVQRHGGRIEVTSSPGTGTTVDIFIPLEGPGETAHTLGASPEDTR